MRNFLLLIGLLFLPVTIACTRANEPAFGTPMMLDPPSSAHVAGPRLSDGPAGDLTLSWIEQREHGAQLRYSSYRAGSFGEATTVVNDPRMFVNWADTPSVMHVGADHWIAHWLRYSADMTYSYDVVVSQSLDGGSSWSTPVTPHVDGTNTEHGFVSMYPSPNGTGLVWLDGRKTAGEPGADVLATSMTLRSAVLDKNGQRRDEQLIDESVCDCCQTSIATGSEGPVAVYRNRTADEIRDIYVTRLIEGQWDTGTPLHGDNWQIAGCPVNGPSIVAGGDDLAIAWFTAANNTPLVQMAISQDGGLTFGEPIEIAAGRLAGYVGITALGRQAYAASWVSRGASGGNSINVRYIGPDGALGPVHPIAETNQLRVFPQLAYRDGHLVLAWTDESDEQRHLRIARVPVTLR